MRRTNFILALAIAALFADRALAQPLPREATAAQKAAASDAYQAGRKAYDAGDFVAALDALHRSHDAIRSPNTQLMIARCLRGLGRTEEARAAYQKTVTEADEAGRDKYSDAADAAQAELAALPEPEPPPAVEPPPQPQVAEPTVNEPEPKSSDAAEKQNPVERRADIGLVLGAKVGAGLGKPWSEFGATPVFELELGYALPPLHRAIELFFSGQYTQPGMSATSSAKDPRLPGNGLVSYEVRQQELTLSLGALYRFDVGSEQLMPYAGLGGRLYLLDTKVKGSVSGQPYGRNEETQTRVGFLLLGGVELYVGPGALLAELSFGWASVNSFVLRNTNLGAWNLAVGYRFVL